MYTRHFGLSTNPFTIAPDPRFLYMGKHHEEALAHLLFGVRGAGGFIQLTGEVGTGKTTLVRSLVADLPRDIDVALVLNPRLNANEFVAAILDELNVPYPPNRASTKLLTDRLNRYLLDTFAKGRRVVLIVDEAQNLHPDVLEQIRLLTNLETNEQKLLQIVLVGQPELAKVLGRHDLRQLAQRITARYHLTPLTAGEVQNYIDHRLATAGADRALFSTAAVKEIYKQSRGIPRLINVICDRALLGAYSAERPVVDKAIARQAAQEVAGRKSASRKWLKHLISPGAALAGIFAIGGTWALTNQAPHHHDAADLPEHHESAAQTPRPDAAPISIESSLFVATEVYRQWFAAWGISELTLSATAPCDEARHHGLRCLDVSGDLNTLIQLDRPALVKLKQAGKNALPIVVLGAHADTFTVTGGGRPFTLTRQDLQQRWPNVFTVLWQPLAGDIEALHPGERHLAVKWLRRQLAPSTPMNELYDAALVEKILALQKKAGLTANGVVTPLTVIHLQNQREASISPRLSRLGQHINKG